MFGDEEDDERDEHRKFHIGRNDLGIEVVRFDRVDDGDHRHDHPYHRSSAVIVPDDEDGYRRKDESENGNESHDEYHDSERRNVGENVSAMDRADNQKSKRRKERVDEGDERLGFENESKSLADLGEDDRILVVEEGEISTLDGFEVSHDFCPVDNENVA